MFGELWWFPGDFRNIHGTISEFRCSEYKEGFFEVMADRFMSMEVMIFTWSDLISSMLFSNIVSSSFFCFNSAVHTNMFKILVKGCGNFRNMLLPCNELRWNLDWCFIQQSVSSNSHSVSVLIGKSCFLICFDYWRCFNLKPINPSSSCLKLDW